MLTEGLEPKNVRHPLREGTGVKITLSTDIGHVEHAMRAHPAILVRHPW